MPLASDIRQTKPPLTMRAGFYDEYNGRLAAYVRARDTHQPKETVAITWRAFQELEYELRDAVLAREKRATAEAVR